MTASCTTSTPVRTANVALHLDRSCPLSPNSRLLLPSYSVPLQHTLLRVLRISLPHAGALPRLSKRKRALVPGGKRMSFWRKAPAFSACLPRPPKKTRQTCNSTLALWVAMSLIVRKTGEREQRFEGRSSAVPFPPPLNKLLSTLIKCSQQ